MIPVADFMRDIYKKIWGFLPRSYTVYILNIRCIIQQLYEVGVQTWHLKKEEYQCEKLFEEMGMF